MTFASGAEVLHFLCAKGVGNLPIQKIPQGWAWGGGMVRLGIVELTDTLRKYWNFSLVFLNPKTPFESSYYLYVKRLIGKQLVYDQCLNCTQRA